MVKVPKVAIFRGEESEYATLMTVFARHSYTVRTVTSIEELVSIESRDGTPCDVVVMGLKAKNASDVMVSGTALVLEIRSQPALSTTPIVVLLQSNDRPAVQTFYGAGADCVLRAPFDPEYVYYQISALARMKRAFQENLNSEGDTLSFHSPILWALNCSREGIIVFNKEKEALFANQSARILLGLETPADVTNCGSQFREQLKPSTAPQSYSLFSVSARSLSLTRSDGQQFIAHLRTIPLHNHKGSVIGYAAGIQDASERGDLSAMLTHSKRLQNVALVAFGGALNWLRLLSQSAILRPIDELRTRLDLEPRSAEFGKVILALLEMLDVVLNPGIEVKVDYQTEHIAAVRFTDLLQLLGSMVFEAIEHAGSAGDARIQASADSTILTIMVSSESRRVTPYLPDDYVGALLQGSELSIDHHGDSIPLGLLEAQRIADTYGASIDYKKAYPELKMRVRLPLVS